MGVDAILKQFTQAPQGNFGERRLANQNLRDTVETRQLNRS